MAKNRRLAGLLVGVDKLAAERWPAKGATRCQRRHPRRWPMGQQWQWPCCCCGVASVNSFVSRPFAPSSFPSPILANVVNLEGGRKGRPPPPPPPSLFLLLVVVAWPLKAVSSHREKVRELAAWAWPKPRKVKEEADGREEDVDVDEKEKKNDVGKG